MKSQVRGYITLILSNVLTKGRFPLGGIFRAERYFLLSFDAHAPPIDLQKKENVAPRGNSA